MGEFEMKKTTILLLVAVLAFGAGTIYGQNRKAISSIGKPELVKETSISPDEVCIGRTNLGDLNGDGKSEFLTNCKDEITILITPSDDGFEPDLEDIKSFPDLFKFSHINSQYLWREVITFPKAKPKFFAIKSTYFSGTSDLEAFGVYQIIDGKAIRVFKLGFDDISGRTFAPIFSDMENKFQTISQSLNTSTSEWNTTVKHYAWDQKQNTFVLTGTKEKPGLYNENK
ncbi:hypothetical protein HYU90_03030 [Candidatus Collierbacteria bacterium]|nr:hypothetical protein [Candidatus Collierbacteria bacterium]